MGDAIDGLLPVYIGFVDSPSSYWITPERCLNAHATVYAVIELEKWLSHHCQSSPTALQPVVPGSHVAFLASPGCWVRGIVEHTVSTLEGPRASVFLVDWGHREPDASFSRLRPLPHKVRELPQLAWNLVLKDVSSTGDENVLQVVKELVGRSKGAALKNVEGKLSGDLYLHLPYDGDWKRHVPTSLIQLLETYDTEHVHLNRMLNDSNFLQLVKNTSSGLSIAGPSAPPKNKGTKLSKKSGSISQERGKLSGSISREKGKLSGSISLEKGKLEDHAKSGKKKSKKRLTMRDYLADPANCNGSTKMNGVYGNPSTSTPLNSSIDEIQGHLNMSGLGRADRLKIASKFDAPKIGYNNNNKGEGRLSDISPIDQYEYAGESGSNSGEKSDKMSGSVIDSVAKVKHGQISLSDHSTTFGTGTGGVRLMPAGAEIVKQKKNKFHKDKNFSERAENCTQASHESNASFLRSNLKNEEEACVSAVDKKVHPKEKHVEEICSFDNSWTPPRFGQYCERASDDDSVLWGDRSESDKREEAGAERREAAQLKNCVLPEEKSVGGLASSGLARNVTPSSQLTDSRFVPDSASSPSLNPSPELADKLLQSSSRAVKRIVFDLGVLEDEESDSGEEYFSANESLGASEDNISSGLDTASIKQELNTAFDNDDKISSTASSSSVKDSPSGISGYKPSNGTESPVGNEASISSAVDSDSVCQELNTDFYKDDKKISTVSSVPSSVKDSPSGIIRCKPSNADETKSLAVTKDFSSPRRDWEKVEESSVRRKSDLEILSVADPRSPSGFPRSPIVINAEKETIQVENEIKEHETLKSNKQNEIKEHDTPNPSKNKLIKFSRKSKEASLDNDGEGSREYTFNTKADHGIERSQVKKELSSQRRNLTENNEIRKCKSASNEATKQEVSKEEGYEAIEYPLEKIQNFNTSSSNQSLHLNYVKQASHTLPGKLFQERFNTREAWTRLVLHRPPQSRGGRSCKLADRVDQLSWCGKLVSFLKNAKPHNVTTSSHLQAALWPAVSRLISVVAIAGEKQGKTWGWALPLLSNLCEDDHYLALPDGQGPKAVVLVSGWKSAADIANLLIDVCDRAKLDVTVVAAYAGEEDKLTASLINGVDVLVVTPACLLRLINEKHSTNLDRCCHFVVEEADRVLEWFPQEVESLMDSWKKVGLKLKRLGALPDQTIVVGERWSESVKGFVKKHLNDIGLIVFGSLLEGVIYGGVPTIPHFVSDSSQKLSRLVEIVKSRGERRVCICCRDAEVGAQLCLHLLQAGVECQLIEEKCEPGEREDKLDNWNMDHTKPLILTDLAIMMNVVDPVPADILIHWDYPKHSKKEFGIRFIMLKPAIKSFYGEENPMSGEFSYKDNNRDPANARIYILLTKEDTHMLKTIINLLKRNGTVIPLDLKNFYFTWKMSLAKQAVLHGEPLCSQLACRGVCRDNKLERCKQRHFLHNEMDQPKEVVSGVLDFLILFVESPVRYWVRILDPALDRKYQSLILKMALYYNKESNIERLKEEDIEMGKTVVARCMDNVYKRARVIHIKPYNSSTGKSRLDKIEIFLLDEGHSVEVDPSDVVKLASEFALEHFPPAAVAVVVTNLSPKDEDSEWSVSAEMFIHNKLNLQPDDHEIKCRGKILLAMANTYWINKCQLMVRQPNIGTWTVEFESREGLLECDNPYAVDNPGHMEPLVQLADRAGVQTPQLETTISTEKADDEEEAAKFAFLPRDDSSQVYVSECLSPWLFYVTKVVGVKSVIDLERYMSSWAEEHVSSRLTYKPMVGDKVMAREGKGGSWFRGEIKQKLGGTKVGEDEAEGNDQWSWDRFKVFQVDTGQTVTVDLTDLAKIPQKFITRLPFQAIKCSLAFVKPATKKSSSENVFEEKTVKEHLDSARINVTHDSSGQNVTQDSTGQNDTQDSMGQNVPEDPMGQNVPEDSGRQNVTQVETLVKKCDLSSSKKIMLKLLQKAKKRRNLAEDATIVQVGDKMIEVEEETKNWVEAAGDKLFDLTRDSEDDPEVLWCDVISVKGSGAHREYTVRLQTKKCKDIAETLVTDGLAQFTYNSDQLAQATYTADQMHLLPQPDTSQVQVDSRDEALDESSPDSSQVFKVVCEEMSKLGFEMTPEVVKELVESLPVKEDSPAPESSFAPFAPLLLTAPVVAPAPPFPAPDAKAVSPLSAFTPVEAAPPLPLSVFVHPRDMPVAAPVPNLIPVKTKKPALVWSQDQTSLKINVTFDTMRELLLEQIYIRVDPGILSIQVSEPLKHASGEEFVVHSTGLLQLHSLVHTRGSTVKVQGRRLMLTLKKCTACQWRQLTKQKMGWIKVDHDRQHSSDSDEASPALGFMGEFLKTGEKGEKDEPKYDAVTGEQVLREADFEQQSDNDYDFDQGDDLLDDAAIDYQPDGYEA